jgi:hypothetical protein
VGGGDQKIVHVQRMIPFKQNSDLDIFVQDTLVEDEKHDFVTPDSKSEQSGCLLPEMEQIPNPGLDSTPEILSKRFTSDGS